MTARVDAAPDTGELRARYLAAQLAGDRRVAMRIVMEEGLAAGVPVGRLQAEVVQAAQGQIGILWQQNRINIAQEHMANAISHVVMSRLFEEAESAPRTGHKIVVACVEGELHEFPARMVADFLELGGYDVRYLGANVPLDDLQRLVDEERPAMLALSVTMNFNAPSLLAAVQRLRESFPDLPILAGGHALHWEPRLASQYGVETCGPEAACVVDSTARMIAARKA